MATLTDIAIKIDKIENAVNRLIAEREEYKNQVNNSATLIENIVDDSVLNKIDNLEATISKVDAKLFRIEAQLDSYSSKVDALLVEVPKQLSDFRNEFN